MACRHTLALVCLIIYLHGRQFRYNFATKVTISFIIFYIVSYLRYSLKDVSYTEIISQ